MACYDLKEAVMNVIITNVVNKREYLTLQNQFLIIFLRGDLPFSVPKFKGGLMVKGNGQNEGIPKGGQMDKGERAF